MKYDIVYSDRKTISICVKDGGVIVRAPRRTARQRIEQIVREHTDWIEKQQQKQSQPRLKNTPLSDSQIAELKKRARVILKQKLDYFSNLMGLKYGRLTITSAKTRFGSCSSKGNIAFSWLLMLYPNEAIDYVVVHELAHLVEMNHSPRFYKIIEAVLPDYKARKKLLKQ